MHQTWKSGHTFFFTSRRKRENQVVTDYESRGWKLASELPLLSTLDKIAFAQSLRRILGEDAIRTDDLALLFRKERCAHQTEDGEIIHDASLEAADEENRLHTGWNTADNAQRKLQVELSEVMREASARLESD